MLRRDALTALLCFSTGAYLSAHTALAQPAASSAATAPTLDRLFARFSKAEGFSANFVETKKIAFLKAPLTNEGRIYFAPPARFARHVDKPTKSSLYIDGDQLVVVDGSGRKNIDLEATPAVKELLQSVLHLLAGKRAEIERAYRLEFSSTARDWTLVLTPKNEKLRGILKQLRFSGSGESLGEMKLVEASGDTSTLVFSQVRHGRKFTEAELKKFLTPPGK